MKKSYLYTNNHYSSKSVVNALMLKAQLGEPIEGEYPPALIEKYPELKELRIGGTEVPPCARCGPPTGYVGRGASSARPLHQRPLRSR